MNRAEDTMQTSEMTRGQSFKGEHLYALMLKLRAQVGGELLPYAGQLTHAAFLRWFAQADSACAVELHEPHTRRPFTCSTLWFPNVDALRSAQQENRHLPVVAHQIYWIRFTLLTEKLFRTFVARYFQDVSPAAGETHDGVVLPQLRLGSVLFDVVEVTTSTPPQHPEHTIQWMGHTTYAELVERARTCNPTASTTRNISLEFRSPTALSNGQRAWGKQMYLFPDHERVFSGLARAWNYWAPVQYALDLQALQGYIREWVTVTHYELRTQTVHFDCATQEGFTGKCTYAFMDAPRESTYRYAQAKVVGAGLTSGQALHLLSSFAFYAGVGYKTTMGMGQVRPLG